jgi:hypothetical protein
MATRAHIAAAALAVVAVAAGCGTPAATTPARRVSPIPSTTGVSPTPVPLVRETGAPPRPPSVAFVVPSGAHDVVVPGKPLVNREWTTDATVAHQGVGRAVPWPIIKTIDGGDNPAIAFATPYVPDFVVVRSYASIDNVDLVPVGMPITTFGCNRFTAPRCTVETTKSGIRIHGLDQTVYAGTYIVVYCEWHLPTKKPGAGVYAPGSLPASWIFRIAHARALAP